MTDIQEFDARALKVTQTVVDRVAADRLDRPTPCGDWTLGQLLAHMTGQNHGFAFAAGGELHGREVWRDRPVGDDPGEEFAASAAAVVAAFGEEGVPEREFWLPEVRGGQWFPAVQAVGFHLVDYVVHGWDVAASIGVGIEFDADVLAAALTVAEAVPTGASREREGAAFAPALDVPAGASVLDRILLLLGRDPNWSAPGHTG
ncbi:TIGR03086 family metal-binding protein [Kitasatospora sp. CB02891]|uniref:TIGR03086 family metal-binding protein n=1 Tax=Kitasatospora sp. CB02891 TaxID=2020329 RepID=UPI000C27D32D|nr:TIGR03086 family metal-binding protein [Kitasatospora sp. CB02891]PJN23886.1 TIGR03086 family protein [Kitasatospora sp. CB02891]